MFVEYEHPQAGHARQVGPLGGEGFRQIRFFPENGWTTGDVMLFTAQGTELLVEQ